MTSIKIKTVLVFLYEVVVGYVAWIIESFTKKPKSMVGKVVVITGGASGIGKEVAQMFANVGAKIALLDVNTELNEKAANEINENGGLAIPFTADVTKPEKMQEVASKIVEHPNLGDPDVLLCNAGILISKGIMEQTDEDIRRTIDINLLGYFWTIRAFLPRIIERNRGHIAAVCSVSGYFGNTDSSAYSASKFGVRGLMESLEWELYDTGKHGVKVTTFYPFFTDTTLLDKCNVRTSFFRMRTVEETAADLVNSILYEKTEGYNSSLISFSCNALKSTIPQQVKKPFKRLMGIHFRYPQ